jgi:hypothetical protein
MDVSPLDPKYVAGLFDGEGTLFIARHKGSGHKRGWTFQARASITIREKWLLEIWKEQFGGWKINTARQASSKHAPAFAWATSDRRIIPFLDVVQPHLLLKAKQAMVVREFVELKAAHGYGPLSDEQYAERERLWSDLKTLNTKGRDRSVR